MSRRVKTWARDVLRPAWRAALWVALPGRRPALRAVRARGGEPAETVRLCLPGRAPATYATPDGFAAAPAGAPDVSIVIVNWHRAALTRRCLKHVFAYTGGAFEAIVVNNGGGADEVAALRDTGARVIALDHNAGFGGASNAGAAVARAPVLVFLNNDAFVTAGWLAPLLAELARPGVAAVGPRLLYPRGDVIQESGGVMPPDGRARLRGRGARADDPAFAADATVDYVSAACVAVRRAEFAAVGGFDPLFHPAYYEDADLCLRLRRFGCARSLAAPVVFHAENASSAGAAVRAAVARNRAAFVARWGAELAAGR